MSAWPSFRRAYWSHFAGLALVALAAGAHLRYQELRTIRRDLLAARQYPYLLNGFQFDILGQTETLKQSVPSQAGPKRILLLAFSDDCGVSKRQVPDWEGLVTEAGRSTVDVWLLTYDTASIVAPVVERLKANQIPYRILKVKNKNRFTLANGLSAMPTTVVLDSDVRLRLIATGMMTERKVRLFKEALSQS